MNSNIVPPSPRLMESLRDLGYDLPSAVADLVDNSIAGKATNVWVQVKFDGENSWIRIADDGRGMTGPRLTEAMRYGSEAEYDDEDSLGKYGLGLKTASLSQCRRLTVATKRVSTGRPQVRQWDVDRVLKRRVWELVRPTRAKLPPQLLEPLASHRGTVVLWERLENVMDFKRPDGKFAENAVIRLCEEIEEHLSMVFHRFLSGEAKRKLPLRIWINGRQIKPWDPYARGETASKPLAAHHLKVDVDGSTQDVAVRAYVLPRQDQFSSTRAFEAAGGPRKWAQQQGFYFYRGDRLIQSGGWSRMRTTDEHTKLGRVAVLFDKGADAAFKINVSKMRVGLSPELKDLLEPIVSNVARRADAVYRKHPDSALGGRVRVGGNGNGNVRATSSARLDRSELRAVARAVVGVVEEELRNQTRLKKNVLRALGELDPTFASAVQGANGA